MDVVDVLEAEALPALLTVEEAAHFLTIGRSHANRLAHE